MQLEMAIPSQDRRKQRKDSNCQYEKKSRPINSKEVRRLPSDLARPSSLDLDICVAHLPVIHLLLVGTGVDFSNLRLPSRQRVQVVWFRIIGGQDVIDV